MLVDRILFYLRTGILLLCLRRLPPFTFSNSSIVRARALISFCCFMILKFLMFILLINYTRDVISESQRKGTAVLGSGQKFCGLLPRVVATGAGICDKAPTRGWGRVAKLSQRMPRNPFFFQKCHSWGRYFFCFEGVRIKFFAEYFRRFLKKLYLCIQKIRYGRAFQ